MIRMTVGKKLVTSTAAMLVLTLILGLAAVTTIDRLSERLDEAVNSTTKKIELINALNVAKSDMLAAQRGVVMFSFGKDEAGVQRANVLFSSAVDRWSSSIAALRPLLETEEGRHLLGELEQRLVAWRGVFDEIKRVCSAGDPMTGIRLAVDKGVPIYEAAGKAAKRIDDIQTSLLDQDREAAAYMNTMSHWAVLPVVIASLLVGGVVVLVVRRISNTLQVAAAELAQGAGQLTSAAAQVASSSQSLAQGASEQAASLEETSASTEEINSMAQKNNENSRAAAELVTQSQRKFAETKTSLDLMVAAMADINASGEKISKIIKVIDEIAFQTNILALNAAVEAARAGEAGMGFAVVADEVRSLAQRCAKAARETSELIEESVTKSNDGKLRVDQVAAAIRTIATESDKVKTFVDDVNVGSNEQVQGIEQVAKAITQMEMVTQSAAATAEESASAAEELTAQAEMMKGIVDRLTSMVGGGGMQPLVAGRHR